MFIAILSNSFGVVSGKEDNVKLSEILEERIESAIKAVADVYYYVVNKGKARKRSIQVLLDELVEPEILDKAKLTRADVERAIGPSATPEEADDLYRWIKKLETKKKKKSKASLGTIDGAAILGDNNATLLDGGDTNGGTISKGTKIGSGPSPSPPIQDENDMKGHLNALRAEIVELKALVKLLANQR